MISPYSKSKLFIEDELTIIDKTGTEKQFVLNDMQNRFVADASSFFDGRHVPFRFIEING